jgi:diguanylate cyclase (GGDEF)-like protein
VIALVALTGWTRSPLIFLLYLPVLLAALRGRALLGLMIGLTISALYMAGAYYRHPIIRAFDSIIVGVALSFPAVAVYTIFLNKRMEDRVRSLTTRTDELKALLDMSQMMDSAFDLDMTLNLILLNTQESTHCNVCAVYLKVDNADEFELKAASGPRDRVHLLPKIAIGDARCGHWAVDASGMPGQPADAFFTGETARNPLAEECALFQIDPRARSFACVPFTSVEGILGMLYVGFDVPNALDDHELTRLEHLATRVTFPLQRVLLQQGFQSLAFSDSKTGLDNHRQFELNLKSELNRAERYGHRLSVLLLDIDHFKNFNDTHGHPAGDAILAQVAVILRNSLRSPDKPARYGGEEFVIVCPETGKEEARLIAERIRKNVAETEFALVADEERASTGAAKTARVTVSIGFATFPQDARNATELTQNADEALYAAKRAGRNTVRGFEDISTRMVSM